MSKPSDELSEQAWKIKRIILKTKALQIRMLVLFRLMMVAMMMMIQMLMISVKDIGSDDSA